MSSKLCAWIRPYPELCLDGDGVFCKPCGKSISGNKKYFIDQHCKTPLHQKNCARKKSNSMSQLSIRQSLSNPSKKNEEDEFKLDLCRSMVQSNIPLYKLNNPSFKTFLEKWCKKQVPDESTLRKKSLDYCYNETISKIKVSLINHFIYIVVDETTDVCGRYIANLLVGVLSEDAPSVPFLVAVKELDKTNNVTISRFIQEGLTNIFLPNAVPFDKIVLMLTDAASYMLRAAINLRVFYPNLIHCTCLAHGVNRVAEEIRSQFPLVNDLINSIKRVFIKAPLRVQVYREILPDIPLPPKPVITRWGTWIEAALFYFTYLKEIKEIMAQFTSESSTAIEDAKNVLKNQKINQYLSYIHTNYKIVIDTILKLEKQNMLLSDSVELVEKLKINIKKLKDPIGQIISKKLDDVLQKNEGFKILCNVSNSLNGIFSTELELSPQIISVLKYAPVTSVDVERSFSAYKNILTDKRQSLKISNLEKHLVIGYNNK